MERRRKGKLRDAGVAGAMTPEARAELASRVEAVAAALTAGAGMPALRELVAPDPLDPTYDVHLMAALGGLNHPAIPALLAACFGGARDKERRKALKRTLHRLKTRGVAVPDDLLPRGEVSLGVRLGASAVFVSPIFNNGENYIILEGPPEILGGNFLVFRVSDREGLQEGMLLSLKRKQQAEFWEQFREMGLGEWISPPPAYAVRLLEEAYTRRPEGGSGTTQYGAWREKIFRHWGRPEEAPDLEETLPAVPAEARGRLRDQARQLALDPLFNHWLPGPAEIKPWLDKLQEVENSPLVLSDQQKQVRADAVMDEATRVLYPLEDREDWRRRLLAMSYYLYLKGREEDSRALRAVADDLRDLDRSALSGENAFLKRLIQYALHLEIESQQPEEPEEPETPSGLVIPPGEFGLIRR